MSDFYPVQSATAPIYAHRPAPEIPKDAVQNLPSANSAHSATDQSRANAQTDQIRAFQERNKQQADFDPDTPTGPPPAFKASLLQVESKLENLLLRIEATRQKAQNDQAIQAAPAADVSSAGDPTAPASQIYQAENIFAPDQNQPTLGASTE